MRAFACRFALTRIQRRLCCTRRRNFLVVGGGVLVWDVENAGLEIGGTDSGDPLRHLLYPVVDQGLM